MIQLQKLSVDFDDHFQLKNIDWQLQPQQHWMLTGSNGAGKSALAAVLAGVGTITAGQISGLPQRVELVSVETQAALIEAERKKDDADIMDVIAEGTTVAEMLADCTDTSLVEELVQKFCLSALLSRAFRKLSTGETRKLLLIRALANQPELLILDEPFDGLDKQALILLQQHLSEIAATVPMLLVLNRLDEMPDFITHIGYLHQGTLSHQIERHHSQAFAELAQLLHLQTTMLTIPPTDASLKLPPLIPQQPLVKLSKAHIRYGDNVIFEDLDWTILPNQHWQLSGPNGSGKTCLLSLITGDHPQCYINDIEVFGFKRGSGESIWQIKQYIGYVSNALQWEYRVSISLRNVIISGFYDSIGLYTKATDKQRDIADQWLALLGMSQRAEQSFNKLSHGDQRLLLIARAMVKHPPLLILDEPCLGLDERNRQLVLALIEKICAQSETTVLYVNHHAEDKIAGIEHYLALGTYHH